MLPHGCPPKCIFAWIALLGAVPANGQSGGFGPAVAIGPRGSNGNAAAPRSDIRVAVNMVEVPVSVTDLLGRPVSGLPKTAFRVFDDGVEQQIAEFSMADGPVSVGIVFDSSGSMRNAIEQSRAAVRQFFDTSVGGDEYCLVRFSDRPNLLTGWTRNSGEISRELAGIRPEGWTAMIDGIRLSMEQLRHASNSRRVLLVLSDGGDNNSRYSESELMAAARETDMQLWAIGLFERPRYLERLANETGGRVIWLHKIAELPDAIERLSREIRDQYVIGYFPDPTPNDGRYHKITVQTVPPPSQPHLRTAWRRGYIAP